MGTNASWISAAGLSKADLLDRLGMVETSQTINLAEQRLDGDTEAGVAVLSSGRILVVFGDYADRVTAAELSVGCELVHCSMSEVVMHSEAFGFKDGEELWSIVHDPSKHRHGVDASGALPSGFDEAMSKAKRGADDDVDYFFDVPIQIAANVGGYRADEDIGDFDNIVQVAEPKLIAQNRAAMAAQAVARAEKAAAWKTSGGLAGAVKRLFGGR